MTGRPWLVILGGINGAGKSTLADVLAEDPQLAGVPFLNPDRATREALAADPSLSERAAHFRGLREVAEEIDRLLVARRTLVTETVLANEAYVRLCQTAKAEGYGVRLLFVGVRTVEDAIARVAIRVGKGGHNVQEPEIRRRWPKAHGNLARIVPVADEVTVFSNAAYGQPPAIVATASAGRVSILDPDALPAVTAALAPLVP